MKQIFQLPVARGAPQSTGDGTPFATVFLCFTVGVGSMLPDKPVTVSVMGINVQLFDTFNTDTLYRHNIMSFMMRTFQQPLTSRSCLSFAYGIGKQLRISLRRYVQVCVCVSLYDVKTSCSTGNNPSTGVTFFTMHACFYL